MKMAGPGLDAIFEQAEYLARQFPDGITDAMNCEVDAIGDSDDRLHAAASQRTLGRIEW